MCPVCLSEAREREQRRRERLRNREGWRGLKEEEEEEGAHVEPFLCLSFE